MRDNASARDGKHMKLHLERIACAAAFLMLFVSLAPAQPYPTRQITLVVPFAPGGPADFLGRLVGQKMSEDLGQQIVVDNRPGANTIIGAQAVAKAAPDGYTLLMAIDGTLVMNPVSLQQACVRSVQGLRPDLADRARPLGGGREYQTPGQLDQGPG